jgi:hypothetical protein
LDGAEGWQWQNGKKTAMTAARVGEMKKGLSTGVQIHYSGYEINPVFADAD